MSKYGFIDKATVRRWIDSGRQDDLCDQVEKMSLDILALESDINETKDQLISAQTRIISMGELTCKLEGYVERVRETDSADKETPPARGDGVSR